MKKIEFILPLLSLMVLMIAGLFVGSYESAPSSFILHYRLPRMLQAVSTGAALSVSGLLLQTLFTNPLCEPYTLGISSGATLGAVAATLFGFSLGGELGLAVPGFLGAFLFLLLLIGISKKMDDRTERVLLVGVLLGLVGSSLVTVGMALLDPSGIQAAFSWLLGDLSRVSLGESCITLLLIALIIFLSRFNSKNWDGLLLGWDGAISIGLKPRSAMKWGLIVSSLLTALSVSTSGMIGFVGLLTPHFARSRVGSLHRRAIPITALYGSLAVVSADLLSRLFLHLIGSTLDLPIGVVTTLLGAPFFIFYLLRSK